MSYDLQPAGTQPHPLRPLPLFFLSNILPLQPLFSFDDGGDDDHMDNVNDDDEDHVDDDETKSG